MGELEIFWFRFFRSADVIGRRNGYLPGGKDAEIFSLRRVHNSFSDHCRLGFLLLLMVVVGPCWAIIYDEVAASRSFNRVTITTTIIFSFFFVESCGQ